MANLPEHLSFKTWAEKRSLDKAAAALDKMPLDEVARSLSEIFAPVLAEGEPEPDWLYLINLERRLIKHLAKSAVGRDQTRRSCVKQRRDSLDKRDQASLNLRRDLWAVAVKIDNHYGRDALKPLGLVGTRPKNAEIVHDLAIFVRDTLLSDWFEFPAPLEGRTHLDPADLAAELNTSINQVNTKLTLVEDRWESAVDALAGKHTAQDWASTGRQTLIGRLRLLLMLAKRPDLAKRLMLRQPQTLAEASQVDPVPPADDSGGDPSPGEPGGDPPSGDSGGDPPSGDSGGDPPSGDSGGDPPSGESGGDPPSGDSGADPSSGDSGGDPPSGDSGDDPPSGDSGPS